jgi:hypothetical protein
MNTLIYKRTHTGDPDKSRVFGCRDCMGRVRSRNFNAVIGIGSRRPDHGDEDIAFKINWIGLNPTKTKPRKRKYRGPSLEFKPASFRLWDNIGPDLKTYAPRLFKYMFEEPKSPFRRHFMSKSLSVEMQEEVTKILKLVENQRSTKSGVSGKTQSTKCKCTR